MLSAESRLSAVSTSGMPSSPFAVGCRADMSTQDAKTLNRISPAIRYRKMNTGSGSRLPVRSIQPSMPVLVAGVPSDGAMLAPSLYGKIPGSIGQGPGEGKSATARRGAPGEGTVVVSDLSTTGEEASHGAGQRYPEVEGRRAVVGVAARDRAGEPRDDGCEGRRRRRRAGRRPPRRHLHRARLRQEGGAGRPLLAGVAGERDHDHAGGVCGAAALRGRVPGADDRQADPPPAGAR